jgi:hypothetical protein
MGSLKLLGAAIAVLVCQVFRRLGPFLVQAPTVMWNEVVRD